MKVVAGFLKKEFVQVLRDPVMRFFIFFVPVFQMLVLGYAIDNQFKNIRLAVSYPPDDVIMRQLSEKFYASGWFVRGGYSASPNDLLNSESVDAVLVSPAGGLTRSMERGPSRVQLVIDASNATKAKAVERYAYSIINQFESSLAPDRNRPLLTIRTRTLFNPEGKTSLFMVPGIMTMVVCLVTIMLTGMSLAREKEMGTFETIIAAPVKNTQIILGKTLPYVAMGLADAFLVIAAGKLIFNVPIRGSIFMLGASTVIFICTTVSIGMLISTFSGNQQQAMLGTFIFLFPANLLSGLFFPIENMPVVIRVVAYFDPLMYFIRILRNIMLKGANPGMVWSNIAVLSVMGLCVISVTVARFRQTLN